MHTVSETSKPNKAEKIISFIFWTIGLAYLGFAALVLVFLSTASGC